MTKQPKRRPGCTSYCAGRLYGIAENLKLRGELAEDFEIEVVPMKGVMWVPGETWVAKCEHGREFILRPTKATQRKYGDRRPANGEAE